MIRAGFVTDANTYLNGIVKSEYDDVDKFIKEVVKFIDGLKKGWHVESITEIEPNTWKIDVIKRA